MWAIRQATPIRRGIKIRFWGLRQATPIRLDVPATEVVKKGLDVAKMDAKLLEKIEELTLYSIQQQKEIDELKHLVRQLVEKK